MSITQEEMQQLIYDPSLIQRRQLVMLEESLSGDYSITDASNPFNFVLESANATASAAIQECNNIIRKKYPSLANTKDDLYHHLSDAQLSNVFSYPAEVEINFFVSIIDLKDKGYRPNGANYVECTIPKYTKIEIVGVDLLTLNDINVKLYDNSSIFVEQQLNSDNLLAYSDVGTLSSTLYTSAEETPWIYFRTKVKQLSYITANKTIIASDGFQHIIATTDLFCSANVSYTASGITKQLTVKYNDEYIDPLTPSVYLSPYVTNLLIRIPDVYLNNGTVSGVCRMDIYTTKGKLYIPINKYPTSDYSITLGATGTSNQTAVMKNIALLANSSGIINGGSNSVTDLELRSTIMHMLSSSTLPITSKQLENYANLQGYKVLLDTDVVTGRTFMALRSLPDMSSSLILAKQDVFFNTVRLILSEANTDFVVTSGSYIIIKANTVFKVKNGITTVATKTEMDYLNNLPNVSLIEYLKTNKYYYTPFLYVLEVNETFTSSRVYDLERPTMDNIRIINKNLTVNHRVNIDKYAIERHNNGWYIYLTLAPNAEFNNLDINSIKVQMKIKLYGSNSYIYFDSTYLEDTKMYRFSIESNMLLDENDTLTITNGTSELYTKKIELSVTPEFFIMSKDPLASDPSKFLSNEIYNNSSTNWTVFSKETIEIVLGIRLTYIYNKLYNVYTDRKYKTYQYDLPMVYEEDVFELDENGCPCVCNEAEDGEEHEMLFNILHKKGEQVLDEEGNPVYKFRKGDTVLDEEGNPIVDTQSGVVRYIDILQLEYEFLLANTPAYENYREAVIDVLHQYTTTDMENLADSLLENTDIYYKSYKTAKDVAVLVNSVPENISYLCTPSVTLYLSTTTALTSSDLDNYKNILGTIISKHLDNATIKVEDIKTDIKAELGSLVAGIKIENLDTKNSEVIIVKNENVKLSLNKTLYIDANNNYIVKYNIDLNIQYV